MRLVVFVAAFILASHNTPTLNKTNAAKHLNYQSQQPAQVKAAAAVPETEQPQVKAEVAVTPAPAPQQAVTQPQTPVPSSGSHEDWMTQAGINPADFGAVDYIISHESSWRYWAQEPTTGAYGLCQSLPGIKMASVSPDWQTNPVTQLKWCTQYAVSRYGSWWGAYNTWVAQRWW